jgi:hypothetical protein
MQFKNMKPFLAGLNLTKLLLEIMGEYMKK